MEKPSILIIDNEPGFLSSLEMLLSADFNVYTAANGREGLHIIKSNDFISMILLDLEMPVMNGVEMLRSIRDEDSEIKVIIMTGRSCHSWAAECADLNIQGYIRKPFDPPRLISRIKSHLKINESEFFRTMWGDNFIVYMASFSPSVKRVLALVEKKFRSSLSREDMAGRLKMSPQHLSRIFSKECGMSLSRYINERRIFESKLLLSNEEKVNISHVAVKVGLEESNYFSRMFKKYTGITPGEYIKKNNIFINTLNNR